MSKTKLIFASLLCLPIMAMSLPASAASTHDIQSGDHSSNSNSGAMGGPMGGSMKKMRMHKKHMKHMKAM